MGSVTNYWKPAWNRIIRIHTLDLIEQRGSMVVILGLIVFGFLIVPDKLQLSEAAPGMSATARQVD